MRQRNSSPKRRGSPGPGAYDPKPTSALGQSHRKGQTSSFKSSSERPLGINGPKSADKTGDPGQYDPHSSYTMAGKKSFGYEETPSASALEKMKNRPKKSGGKLGAFGGGSAKRELRMDLMGESTPGPGSYMPASTFGKHAVSKEAQMQRSRPTSAFKSMSLQRARPHNEAVPGPGTHTPNHGSIEKNRTNPGSSLSSKSKRIGAGGVGSPDAVATDSDIGPGAYEAHLHKSMAKSIAKKVEMMSRQNPGFGIAGPAHELPHEQTVEDDQDLPGPGKYESKLVEGAANGHSSSFKLPTKRSKAPPDDWNSSGDGGGGSKGKPKGSGGKKADASKGTIHV